MNKEFQTLRKKQRFSIRKLNIGVASVLLGFTIFGYNLVSQAPVAHAATIVGSGASGSSATGVASGSPTSSVANASQATPATQVPTSVKQTKSVTNMTPSAGSSATGVASGSQDSNSQAASPTSSVANASQAAPATQVPAPAASQSSESANSGNATSSQASQVGTVSANQTSNTSAAGAPASSDQTVTVDETTLPATKAAMLLTNLARLKNSGTDTTLPPTTQTYTKVEQPLLYDYGLHVSATGTRDGKTWVNKTVAKGIFGQDYPGHTLDTIFGSKTGIITSKPDRYFFAAYVDFSESYHRVILLARSQDPSDKNLYSYTIHTYTQNTSTTTTKPGDSTKEQYTGTGGSTHDLIFQNYGGDSFTVKLNGLKEGYGLLPVFDGGLLDPTYGSNTLDQNDEAAKTKSIGFWASAIPQETSTKVRYVDQATGKDIVQPMEISGFGYQGFKVNGDAPTVDGYHLVSSPKFLGLPYEDGTIAPYKVGQTYDLALSDSVVIKQTVIHTDGTVRATAYYKGSPVTNASKVLGRESYNDHMSFGAPDGKFYTYTNRIGQVGDSYIYYYAKNNDPKGSEMRLHFIDVTGVNNSSYAPSDGPELDADKVQTIHGNIGDNYSFTYTVPKGYDQVGTSDVTGTYSVTRHDAYVYVKKYTVAAGQAVTLTHGQKVKEGDSLDSSAVTLKDAKGQAVSLPDGAKVVWATAPDTSEVGNDKTGQAKVVYGDTSESEPVTVTYNVTPNDADQYTPTVPAKTKVDDPTKLTDDEKKEVADKVTDFNQLITFDSVD
ncbi:YSIRK-type signal peptide-containing protein [Ligilactobacillus sp. UO.C109]|uniref:YSIRK-type signal peptide-containing protein n=1 Tax=Ligilactobacillus sp. UO.C109 TaxID=3003264 RepID=UPI0022863EEA|nr:YSIRK-type signal peptide-containing protein [Ligilactobacillus sp. UO.C109]MCZ0744191.1 YSIRK-type signal peptide-containing protein [Ligilactobacillus sp. UO.C109]